MVQRSPPPLKNRVFGVRFEFILSRVTYYMCCTGFSVRFLVWLTIFAKAFVFRELRRSAKLYVVALVVPGGMFYKAVNV